MEYVLAVEDDAAIRSLIVQLLARKSIAVRTAATAAEARSVLAEFGCAQLAIIDVVLPDGDGADLLREVSRTCPGAKAILMSGYPPDELREHGFTFAVTYLEKPFDTRELLAAVEAALKPRT